MAKFKLREILEKHEITPYALWKSDAVNISKQGVYDLTSEEKPPKAIKFETLSEVIKGLKILTGESYTPNDLLSVE